MPNGRVSDGFALRLRYIDAKATFRDAAAAFDRSPLAALRPMLRAWTQAPAGTRTAADQLAIEQERASLALDAGRMGEFEWEMDEDRLIVSPRMAAITGSPAGSMPADGGQAAFSYVHPDDVDELRLRSTESLRAHGRYELEFRMIRPDDGRVLYICSAGVAPPASPGGGRWPIGVVQDITQRHAEDAACNALVAELDHRVKNVLASGVVAGRPVGPQDHVARRVPENLRWTARGHGLGAYAADRHALARG